MASPAKIANGKVRNRGVETLYEVSRSIVVNFKETFDE